MPHFICTTCGVQHAESILPPERCAVCEDDRQYIGWGGQLWTTLPELRATHSNTFRPKGPDLIGVGTEPGFAIGQRALLVRDEAFPVLWDCISLVDEATVAAVRAAGGVRAIAISHPHYYSAMVEWARAFDVPVYLHAADREWVMRPDPALTFWEGDSCRLADDLTLIRCGGHYAGGTVLHWAAGAEGRGALLSGDIVQVVPDVAHVGFMYSYPNLIPLPEAAVARIAAALAPYPFERIHGAWWGRLVPRDGAAVVQRSAERYGRALRGAL